MCQPNATEKKEIWGGVPFDTSRECRVAGDWMAALTSPTSPPKAWFSSPQMSTERGQE